LEWPVVKPHFLDKPGVAAIFVEFIEGATHS
jgi:hypothetical protein